MSSFKAYVFIVNESGSEDSVLSNLNVIPSVSSAFGTFGAYDILAKLESDNEQDIQNSISTKIRKIPKIRSTLTLLVDSKPGLSKTNSSEDKILDTHMAQAYVMIRCPKSSEPDVLNGLKQISEVTYADFLVGRYDILCKVAAPTYNDISKIIGTKIRKIPNLKSTVTINVINNQGFCK